MISVIEKKKIFFPKQINKLASDELIIEDTDIKWDADDFGNEEISEEEQARLLEQYEAEIMEREKRKSQVVPLEEKVNYFLAPNNVNLMVEVRIFFLFK